MKRVERNSRESVRLDVLAASFASVVVLVKDDHRSFNFTKTLGLIPHHLRPGRCAWVHR